VTAPDRTFAALADPTRRALFEAVARSGPATATELARSRPITRQAVAKHLSVLQAVGLVAGERVGRETRFTAAPGALEDITRWVAEVGAARDRRLERLQRQLGR
jgi:DNA-binding transcriptional ArsR family regulator